MPGSMRILVSTPAIAYEDIVSNEILRSSFINDPIEFQIPHSHTLDEFGHGLHGVCPRNMFGLNIPNFPLEANASQGIAGPGLPHDELFWPPDLKRKLGSLCGKYDKWRPYPADEPLSNYAKKMARRFANKRCKMFEYASRKLSWDLLFYVEHAPASIAHLDRNAALEVAEYVFRRVVRMNAEWPSVPIVVFSPYGLHGRRGFSLHKNWPNSIRNWEHIRSYIGG